MAPWPLARVRVLLLIGFVCALVPALPVAGAQGDVGEELCVIFITPEADFRRIEIVQDLILTENEVEEMMRDADTDDDGNVTTEEVDAYEAASARSLPHDALGEKSLLVDDRPPGNTVISLRLTGFEGPVDGSRKVLASEVRDYTFSETPAQSAHFVEGGSAAQYDPQPVVETVVITAPERWVVWSVNGTEYREESVTIRGFDTRTSFEIVFAREGTTPPEPPVEDRWTIPGPGSVAPLVIALALVRTIDFCRKDDARPSPMKRS